MFSDSVGVGLKPVRFHDLRHFAATMFASTGASTKEIMSRGGWRSVTMVVRYEHASEERDALLADALNPCTETGIVRLAHVAPTKAMVLQAMKRVRRLSRGKTMQKAPGERLELST